MGGRAVWLVGRLAGWLVGWLAASLTGWRIGWPAGWVGWQAGGSWHGGWLVGGSWVANPRGCQLAAQMIYKLCNWQLDGLGGWQTGSLAGCLASWQAGWLDARFDCQAV